MLFKMVGIPILTDLFHYLYEVDSMQGLLKKNVAASFNLMFHNTDDLQ
jgi:hypothetical protein